MPLIAESPALPRKGIAPAASTPAVNAYRFSLSSYVAALYDLVLPALQTFDLKSRCAPCMEWMKSFRERVMVRIPAVAPTGQPDKNFDRQENTL